MDRLIGIISIFVLMALAVGLGWLVDKILTKFKNGGK